MVLKFGYVFNQPSPPMEEMVRQTKRCEKAGFDSVWISDHILAPPPDRSFLPDAYMTLAVLARNTSRLMLGTVVTCVHRRNYAVLAHLINTLDHFSDGRAVLGVGSGESMNLDPFGIEWSKPISRTVEALDLIKRLWQEEAPFSVEGEYYSLDNGFLQLAPIQMPHPPIYFAANGPKSMRLTGRYYDGWLPFVETPELYSKHIKIVEGGAKEAGRSIEDIECALALATAVCEDSDEAYQTAAPFRQFMIHLPKKLAEAGFDIPPEYPDNYYLKDLMVTKASQKKYEEAREFISEELVRDFSVLGTADECIAQIEKYRQAGLDHLMVFATDPDVERTLGFYEKEIIPYFKDE